MNKKQLFDGIGEFGRTDRVYLYVLTEEDKEIFLSYKMNEGYKGNTYSEAYANALWESANGESILTFCIWNIETEEYLGFCNYSELNHEFPAIGIELVETAQNQGLGYEVCKLLLENYFEKTDMPYIRYEVMRSNVRSRHLAEKLGGKLKEINPLSDALVERNEELPKEKRLDLSALLKMR